MTARDEPWPCDLSQPVRILRFPLLKRVDFVVLRAHLWPILRTLVVDRPYELPRSAQVQPIQDRSERRKSKKKQTGEHTFFMTRDIEDMMVDASVPLPVI